MRVTKIILFIMLLLLASYVNAQVTIGVNEAPVPGALLQLKTIDDETSSGGVNVTRGLGLPRVVLTKQFDLSDIDSVDPSELEGYAGLLVYQVGYQNNADGVFCPGLYVWDATQWQPLFDLSTFDQSRYDAATETLYDSEGNDYKTANFGSAGRWMTQNLRSRVVGLCGMIDYSKQGLEAEWAENRLYYPHGYIDNANPEAGPTQEWTEQWGLLYNWAAATAQKGGNDGKQNTENEADPGDGTDLTERIQGICPKGWHLPSDKEWNDLIKEIAARPSQYSTGTVAEDLDATDPSWRIKNVRGANVGRYMKSVTKVPGDGIQDPQGLSNTYNAASNRGFDALILGAGDKGSKTQYGKDAYFWTSSSNGADNAWFHQLSAEGGAAVINSASRYAHPRHYLYSVRCKQD